MDLAGRVFGHSRGILHQNETFGDIPKIRLTLGVEEGRRI